MTCIIIGEYCNFHKAAIGGDSVGLDIINFSRQEYFWEAMCDLKIGQVRVVFDVISADVRKASWFYEQ